MRCSRADRSVWWGSLGRLVALALAALALATLPAAAQTERPSPTLSLRVQQLTGTLTPEGQLRVQVRVTNRGRAAEGLRVVGTLHRAVASRLAFQLAVDDGRLGTVVDGFSDDIEGLRGDRSTEVEFTRSAAELGLRRPDQFGVYPLRLQLLEEGDVVDEVRTAVVFNSEEVESPVRVALMVPVAAPPLLRGDGTYAHDAVITQFGRAGRVQGLVGSLTRREGFPVTLAPDALLLDEAADMAEGFSLSGAPGDGPDPRDVEPGDHLATQASLLLERLRDVATRRGVDVVGMPYGRADIGALVNEGMLAEAERHVDEARQSIERVTETAPLSDVLWPPDALNAAMLAAVDSAGVDTLVLSERYLRIPDGRALSPSPVRRLEQARGRAPTVLVPDPWLEDVLARDSMRDGVAVTVQRVLAETAAVYFERPFADDTRGLLLTPPQVWSPERGLAGRLIDALGDAPWLEPVTLSRLARTVEPDTDDVRLDFDTAARRRLLPSDYVAALADARRSLGAFAGVLAAEGDDTPSRFDRLLRASASVSFRAAPAQGRDLIGAVSDTVSELYSAIRLVDGPQVWMDSEGPVPVTVANDAEVPLRVRVRLQSQRFIFGDQPIGQPPDERGGWVIPPEDTRTLTFEASAVTPGGRAPVSVVVEDVDGVLVLAEDTLVIRSTAVSVAALIVTGAAGLFLLVWLVGQIARWRRRRRSGAGEEKEPAARPAAQAGSSKRR